MSLFDGKPLSAEEILQRVEAEPCADCTCAKRDHTPNCQFCQWCRRHVSLIRAEDE